MKNVMEKIRGGMHIIKLKLFKKYAPLEINIHITDKCNLKCTYCYSNFYKRKCEDISRQDIFRIVDAFKELGVLEVSLIGGEPFLHPHIADIINYVKDKKLSCSTVTNGYFLERCIDAVKRLNMVCVSVDGPMGVNDITRGDGSYERAIAALELLKNNGVNRSVRATIQKHNVNNIDEIFDVAVRYDAILNFGLLFPQSSEDGKVKTVSKDTPGDADLRKALSKIIELKKKHPARFFNSITNLKNARDWPPPYTRFFLYENELKEFPDFRPIPCYGGRTFATIDTDGRLYPCTNLIGYYDAPNVLKMDVKEAWFNIADHKCRACFYLSSVEKNLVSSLNFDAIRNIIKIGHVR